MPHAFTENVNAQSANALAAHLRVATGSKVIPRTHRVIPHRAPVRDLRVAGGGAFPGLGNLDKPIPAEHVQHLALPLAAKIPRTHRRTLSIPLSHRLPTPRYHSTAQSGGGSFPGIGEWFLGETNFDQMDGLSGRAAGRTTLVRGQKPRTMGGVLPVYHDFIPGLGEEADGDVYTQGYLTATDLAEDGVPSNVAAADAAAAGAAAMKRMILITAAVAALGLVFFRR